MPPGQEGATAAATSERAGVYTSPHPAEPETTVDYHDRAEASHYA